MPERRTLFDRRLPTGEMLGRRRVTEGLLSLEPGLLDRDRKNGTCRIRGIKVMRSSCGDVTRIAALKTLAIVNVIRTEPYQRL